MLNILDYLKPMKHHACHPVVHPGQVAPLFVHVMIMHITTIVIIIHNVI